MNKELENKSYVKIADDLGKIQDKALDEHYAELDPNEGKTLTRANLKENNVNQMNKLISDSFHYIEQTITNASGKYVSPEMHKSLLDVVNTVRRGLLHDSYELLANETSDDFMELQKRNLKR